MYLVGCTAMLAPGSCYVQGDICVEVWVTVLLCLPHVSRNYVAMSPGKMVRGGRDRASWVEIKR